MKAQFLEIYNEELRDLLAGFDSGSSSCGGGAGQQLLDAKHAAEAAGGSSTCSTYSPTKQQRSIAIRESPDGQISVTGEHASCLKFLLFFVG